MDLIIIREKGRLRLIRDTRSKEDIVLTSDKSINKIKKKKAGIGVKPPLSSMTTPNVLLFERKRGEYEKLKKKTIEELVKSVTKRIKIAFPEAEGEIVINPKQLILINRVLIEPKLEKEGYLHKWFKSKKRGEDPFEKLEEFLDPNLIKEEMIRQGIFIKEEKIPQTNELLFRIRLPKQIPLEKAKKQDRKIRKKLKKKVRAV